MKKIILIILLVSLLSFGKEVITKSVDSREYTNVELFLNSDQHNKFNTEEKASCSQCHGCKINDDFDEEKDNLELLRISSSELDTITKDDKDVEFKQLKS